MKKIREFTILARHFIYNNTENYIMHGEFMLQNIKLSTFQSNEIWCAAQIRKNSSQIFYLMGPIE